MQSTDLDQGISQKTAHLEHLKGEAAKLLPDILKSITTHVSGWYEAVTMRAMKDQPEKFAALGSKVTELKKEIYALRDSAEAMIHRSIGSHRNIWWHINEGCLEEWNLHHIMPEMLHVEIRRVMSRLGPVLVTYGLLKSSEIHKHSHDYRNVAFPSALGRIPELEALLVKYQSILKEARTITYERDKLKKQQATLKAAELWESA